MNCMFRKYTECIRKKKLKPIDFRYGIDNEIDQLPTLGLSLLLQKSVDY